MSLRKINSDLEGHPTPRLSFIDVDRDLGKAFYRTYCLMGDGESMEGNIWEALNFAGFYKLNNLCAIIDVNRLGQSDPAPLEHDMDTYKRRMQFPLNDILDFCKGFDEAENVSDKPEI